MVTFKGATVSGFKKACDFKGVATRAEYWWFALASVLIGIVLGLVTEIATIFVFLVLPLQLWAGLAGVSLAFRRVRDAGGSVWWILASLACAILLLVTAISSVGSIDNPEPNLLAIGVMAIFSVGYLVCSLVTFVYTLIPTKPKQIEELSAPAVVMDSAED